MAVDQNQQSRRPHYHRGRRGPDRRSAERRSTPPQEQSARSGDQVDVEQIMRDIRSRIAQRHGIELSTQQIQELAARRLEAILDPRTINPSLMQQLRRGASTPPEVPAAPVDPGYVFEATTLYESHRGLLRFMRKLLNPILKLFFNPNPLVQALHTQARLNREAAAREAERDRTHTEWNALHYEIVQRLVTEVSRVSVEVQSLTLQVEALAARVDYNDRKVRALDTTTPQPAPRPPARTPEPPVAAPPAPAAETVSADSGSADATQGEGTRRRRRRRRGRRGGTVAAEIGAPTVVVGGSEGLAGPDSADLINGDEGEGEEEEDSLERSAAEPKAEPPAVFEPAAEPPMPEPPASHPPLSAAPASAPFESPREPEVAESIPLGAHQQPDAPLPPSDPGVTAAAAPPPEPVAAPPDEPSARPPEPNPGPPDR